MKHELRVKRIYDEPLESDGFRILVDRLWPRGVSKSVARIDCWAKMLAPSHDLRKWYHANPVRHADFAERYMAELNNATFEIKTLIESVQLPVVTLITATKDLDNGHVAVLRTHLVTALT